MTTFHQLNAEDAHRAASRLEDAAKAANSAADRIEEAVRQLRFMTEDGYGNNVTRLIELLTKLPEPSSPSPLTVAMPNTDAWRLGEVCLKAASPEQKVGDRIDRGLILRRLLEEAGYLIIKK